MRILSGLCMMAPITGCSAPMSCCAIHWAAFCNQQVASNGLRHTAAGAFAFVIPSEVGSGPQTDRMRKTGSGNKTRLAGCSTLP